MVFLPHTSTVILLEPYCGTTTEPGLPVVRTVNYRNLNYGPKTRLIRGTYDTKAAFNNWFIIHSE